MIWLYLILTSVEIVNRYVVGYYYLYYTTIDPDSAVRGFNNCLHKLVSGVRIRPEWVNY